MCLGRHDFRASLLNRADRALTRSGRKKLLGFGASPWERLPAAIYPQSRLEAAPTGVFATDSSTFRRAHESPISGNGR